MFQQGWLLSRRVLMTDPPMAAHEVVAERDELREEVGSRGSYPAILMLSWKDQSSTP